MPRRSKRARARAIYRERTRATAPRAQTQRGTDLTTRVRALYEDTIVTVREIARIAGVTERTVYKHARRHQWKRRHSWALVLGDPGRAVAECQEAEERARAAQREAEVAQRFEDRMRAIDAANRALDKLADYLEERDKRLAGRPVPENDPVEDALRLAVDFAADRWDALLAEKREKQNGEPSF